MIRVGDDVIVVMPGRVVKGTVTKIEHEPGENAPGTVTEIPLTVQAVYRKDATGKWSAATPVKVTA